MEKTIDEVIDDFFASIPKCNLSEEELEKIREQNLLDEIKYYDNLLRDEKGRAIF